MVTDQKMGFYSSRERAVKRWLVKGIAWRKTRHEIIYALARSKSFYIVDVLGWYSRVVYISLYRFVTWDVKCGEWLVDSHWQARKKTNKQTKDMKVLAKTIV